MRLRMSDGTRRVRSMNPVAFLAESQPACAQWIVFAGWDHLARVVVRWIGDASHDLKLAGWTRTRRGAHGYRKSGDDVSVFNDRQFAVGNANQHGPLRTIAGYGRRGL